MGIPENTYGLLAKCVVPKLRIEIVPNKIIFEDGRSYAEANDKPTNCEIKIDNELTPFGIQDVVGNTELVDTPGHLTFPVNLRISAIARSWMISTKKPSAEWKHGHSASAENRGNTFQVNIGCTYKKLRKTAFMVFKDHEFTDEEIYASGLSYDGENRCLLRHPNLIIVDNDFWKLLSRGERLSDKDVKKIQAITATANEKVRKLYDATDKEALGEEILIGIVVRYLEKHAQHDPGAYRLEDPFHEGEWINLPT